MTLQKVIRDRNKNRDGHSSRDQSMTQYHARDKKLDENYFNQQFSHTPNNKQSNQPNVIVEEIDESSRRSRSDS